MPDGPPDTVFHGFMKTEELAGEAAFYERFLDTMQSLPAIKENQRRVTERLEVREGTQFLDVGCGTGLYLIDVAKLVGPSGLAAGLDQSEAMLGIANTKAREAGVQIETHIGDAMALPFEAGQFDAVRSERLLQYLPDAQVAVNEMVRVVRPGGKIAGSELDWDTMICDLPDIDRGAWRRMLTDMADNSGNPWMGRQMDRTFRASGLQDVQTQPIVFEVRDYATIWENLGGRLSTERAAATGAITEEERAQLAASLEAAGKENRFYFTATVFTTSGAKPN